MTPLRFILIICLFAADLSLAETPETLQSKRCSFPANYSNDGPWSMNGYSNWVETAMNNVDANGAELLNGYAIEWNDPTCLLFDGRPRLSGMLKGLSNSIYYSGKNWENSLARTEKLKSRLPTAPVSAVAEAQYWFNYAWEARGSGYSSSVTEDGMKLFRERLQKAEKTLHDSKSYASSLPVWYEQMLLIKSSAGAPQRERDAILREGVEKFRWYLPIYYARANYLTPWWGGSWEEVENFALWSVEQTKADLGDTLYARIYWGMSGYTQVSNIFKDTRASWPRMRKGFEDMVKRYPKSAWILHGYARFACDAGDKASYLKLRKRLSFESREMEEAWSKNSRPEVCDAKFGHRI